MSKTAIRLQHNDEIAAEARGDSVHLRTPPCAFRCPAPDAAHGSRVGRAIA